MDDQNENLPPRRDQFEDRKDFVRAYDRWRDKNDPRRKARSKARTEAGYQKEMYAKHREKRLAQKKTLSGTPEHLELRAAWRDANRDKVREQNQRRYQKNPEYFYERNLLRKERERQASPPWLTNKQWNEMAAKYELAREMTERTGILHSVDHINPIAGKNSCGLHVPWNLRVVLDTVNRRKTNKEPDDG